MTAGAGRRARLESELTAAEAATVAELAHALYVPADARTCWSGCSARASR